MKRKQPPERTNHNLTRIERVRRCIVALIYVTYVLLIVDGALRKWAFPQLEKEFYFLRDPAIIACYLISIKEGLWPSRSAIYKGTVCIFAVFLGQVFLQMANYSIDPIVYVFGLRMYFFLVPFALLIQTAFKPKDVYRLIYITALIVIPEAILAFLQFHSPIDSWINRTIGTGTQATSDFIHVRPSGTFLDGRTMPLLIGSSFALIFPQWLKAPRQRVLPAPLLFVSSACIFLLLAYNGNRAGWYYVMFSALFCSPYFFLVKSWSIRRKALRGLLTFVFMGLMLMSLAFHEGLEAMAFRQTHAVSREGSTVSRMIRSFTDIFTALDNTPIIGLGLGYGSGGGRFMATGARQFTLAEGEWLRNLQEAGLLSFLYIGLRVAICCHILRGAIEATRRIASPLPLSLCGFILPLLGIGPITAMGTFHGYCWFFVGLSLAVNRLGLARPISFSSKIQVDLN